MKKFIYTIFIFISSSMLIFAGNELLGERFLKQNTPNTPTMAARDIYFGGGIGFSFGNYTRISVKPIVGYKITPKLSVGLSVEYEYITDKRYSSTLTASNYGGSIFSRFRVIPQLFLHAEFAYMSYQYRVSDFTSDRTGVPFLFVGAGFSQQISPGVWAYAQVLFDVLQDSNSPYKEWEPFYSVGVGVGF